MGDPLERALANSSLNSMHEQLELFSYVSAKELMRQPMVLEGRKEQQRLSIILTVTP